MKVIGVIAEYNPFHNGHAYQLDNIRKDTGADYIIVAMSGDFMQRGTPAIIDKYSRAQMALSCGADLVLELPALWATASAEFFAMAGVTLFDKAGCIDGICFGAETDNFPLLTCIAEILAEEPQAYRSVLSSYLKEGLPFPAARAAALCDYLMHNLPSRTSDSGKSSPHIAACDADTICAILNEPNNILAIEYLKAIQKRGSSLTPYLIKREGAGYHETVIHHAKADTVAAPLLRADNLCSAPIASATAIRNVLTKYTADDSDISRSALSELSDALPQNVLEILEEYLSSCSLLQADDFSSILSYLLLCKSPAKIADIADSNEDIANRLFKNRFQCSSFSQFCTLNKSRDITYTRMSRILLHIILNITDTDYKRGKDLDYIPYLRILGFRRDSSALLRTLKEASCIPLISKLADASGLLAPEALTMLEKDIFAADLYEQMLTQKAKKTTSRSEYSREIVIL